MIFEDTYDALDAAEDDCKTIAGYLALAAEQNNAPKGMIKVAETDNKALLQGIQRATLEGEKMEAANEAEMAAGEANETMLYTSVYDIVPRDTKVIV